MASDTLISVTVTAKHGDRYREAEQQVERPAPGRRMPHEARELLPESARRRGKRLQRRSGHPDEADGQGAFELHEGMDDAARSDEDRNADQRQHEQTDAQRQRGHDDRDVDGGEWQCQQQLHGAEVRPGRGDHREEPLSLRWRSVDHGDTSSIGVMDQRRLGRVGIVRVIRPDPVRARPREPHDRLR
jgi:hypothetical protein